MDPIIFQMRRYSETLDKTSFTWLANEQKKKKNRNSSNHKNKKIKEKQNHKRKKKEISYHIWRLHTRAYKN